METRKKMPDMKKALDLIESASKEVDFTYTLPLKDESSNTVIKNIYESFRMLGEALLVSKGIEPKDHVSCIKELLNLNLDTSRPLTLLESLRKLRHNINYYGYRAGIEESKDVISISKSCFKPLFDKIKGLINMKENSRKQKRGKNV